MAKTISPIHEKRLIERGLDPALCLRLGVHSSGKAIAFDYRRKGSVHNTKMRYEKGNMPWEIREKPTILWNEDCLSLPAKDNETVIITEGEFDAIALIQAGFKRVVSVPNGAPAAASEETDNRYGYLFADPQTRKKILPELDQFKRIVLATDNDAPGRFLRDELAFRLGDERCFWVQWPGSCKDANDLLVSGGEESLVVSVQTAKRMWNEQLSSINDVPERDVLTYTTGINNLDVNIVLPEFMIMMGPYGCGKSVFLRQLLWNLWKLHGWKFMLTCLEEPIKPRVRDHFRALEIGVSPGQWTAAEIEHADRQILEAGMFLQRPWVDKLTPEGFLGFAELAIKRDKVRVIALDPVNELDHSIGRNESQYWAEFIIECKRLADKYRILFIACGHPPKDAYRIIAQGGILGAVDMSGSQHWGNKNDHAFVFWKPDRFWWGADPDDALPTLLHMEKSKDHDTMGRPNMYELRFINGVNKFEVANTGFSMMKRKARRNDAE